MYFRPFTIDTKASDNDNTDNNTDKALVAPAKRLSARETTRLYE